MFAKCSWLTHLIHANLITSHRRCWQRMWRCANILNPRWPTGMIENIFGMRRYILWTSQSATPYQSFINVANYQINLLVAPWNSVLICRNYIMLPKHTCLKSSLINPHPIFSAIKILSISPVMLKAFFANVIVKHLTWLKSHQQSGKRSIVFFNKCPPMHQIKTLYETNDKLK